jgi:hypothetical protein
MDKKHWTIDNGHKHVTFRVESGQWTIEMDLRQLTMENGHWTIGNGKLTMDIEQ